MELWGQHSRPSFNMICIVYCLLFVINSFSGHGLPHTFDGHRPFCFNYMNDYRCAVCPSFGNIYIYLVMFSYEFSFDIKSGMGFVNPVPVNLATQLGLIYALWLFDDGRGLAYIYIVAVIRNLPLWFCFVPRMSLGGVNGSVTRPCVYSGKEPAQDLLMPRAIMVTCFTTRVSAITVYQTRG